MAKCDFCGLEAALVARLIADPDQKVCTICHNDERIPTEGLNMANEKYQQALKDGFTHCVSYCLPFDDPKEPWRQTFFKNLKAAKQCAKDMQARGSRAIYSGMYSPCPRR